MPPRWIRLAAPLLLLASGLALAFSTGPPASVTGAPAIAPAAAEGLCIQCHTGNTVNTNGTLEILNVPAVYKPDSQYIFTVRLTSTANSGFANRKWGFEITAVNASTGAGFGTLARTNADTTSTQVISGAGGFSTRRYVEHTSTGTRTSQASPSQWTLRWTAPNAAASTVRARFFAAGNAANGNGVNSGDFIYTASAASLPPARVSAVASINFGTVIAGNGSHVPLQVGNTTPAPGDSLQYRLIAPSGFSATPGPFAVKAGSPAYGSLVWMDDASSGSRSGNLLIASNDPVTPTRTVALSGTVLGHCRPTLDSLTIVTHDAIGWGAPSSGQFRDTTVRVFNFGFDATRARLHLAGATITGGGGRFTLPGGFTPQLVGATPASLSLRFDEAGATPDSTYTAYLTLACTDEALPGAVTHPSLVVRLAARVNNGGTVAVEPLATLTDRLLPVRPNPVAGRAALGFELARGGDVTLELYDVHGRRVRRIVRGPLEPGRYTYEWNGADDRGAALPAGVYVVRLSAPGGSASRRVALVR